MPGPQSSRLQQPSTDHPNAAGLANEWAVERSHPPVVADLVERLKAEDGQPGLTWYDSIRHVQPLTGWTGARLLQAVRAPPVSKYIGTGASGRGVAAWFRAPYS